VSGRGPTRPGLLAAALILGLAAAACANGGSTLGVQEIINPSPGTPVGFATDVQPIFTNNCTFFGCHNSTDRAQGLVLQAGSSYTSLLGAGGLGRTETENPSLTLLLVDPSHSASSYIILKLEGTAPAPSNTQMPLNLAPLSSPTIQVIKDWIDQGALNN
jgi:hypothetical protein